MLRMAMVFLLILLAGAAPSAAQVRYKDSDGIVHFVDSIDQVPEKYRTGAVRNARPRSLDVERKAPVAQPSAVEALKALRAIQSVTEGGVNLQEYSTCINDARIKVDQYVAETGTENPAGMSMKDAANLYSLAG